MGEKKVNGDLDELRMCKCADVQIEYRIQGMCFARSSFSVGGCKCADGIQGMGARFRTDEPTSLKCLSSCHCLFSRGNGGKLRKWRKNTNTACWRLIDRTRKCAGLNTSDMKKLALANLRFFVLVFNTILKISAYRLCRHQVIIH